MLNQPTQYAFAQDFLVHANGRAKILLDAGESGSVNCPIRLARFARVLREPETVFQHAHLGQFPMAARPLFGDFAVCSACLREGFHSLLFSVRGLTRCPVHGLALGRRVCCETLSNTLVVGGPRQRYGRCGCGEVLLDFPNARFPVKNPERDAYLGELAAWIYRASGGQAHESLSPKGPSAAGPAPPYARIKAALSAPGCAPGWALAPDYAPQDGAALVTMTYGAAKVPVGDPHHNPAPRLGRHSFSPYTFQQTLFCDFKAVNRYLRHHTLGAQRRWIARFVRARGIQAVEDLLSAGGESAQRAWTVLLWWQSCVQDLKLANWFTSRPCRLVGVGDVPAWMDERRHQASALPGSAGAREWVVRWVSALGLQAHWRHTLVLAGHVNSPMIALIGKGITAVRQMPLWSLGVTREARLVLCADRAMGPGWQACGRRGREERRRRHDEAFQSRIARVRAVCQQPCLWYHGDALEWTSGPGPEPVAPSDCKKHRLLPANLNLWFVVVPGPMAQPPSRAFVGRCLELPLAATGPTAAQAVAHLKSAVRQYAALHRTD